MSMKWAPNVSYNTMTFASRVSTMYAMGMVISFIGIYLR